MQVRVDYSDFTLFFVQVVRTKYVHTYTYGDLPELDIRFACGECGRYCQVAAFHSCRIQPCKARGVANAREREREKSLKYVKRTFIGCSGLPVPVGWTQPHGPGPNLQIIFAILVIMLYEYIVTFV